MKAKLKLTIRNKLILGFSINAVAVLLVFITLFFSYRNNKNISQQNINLYSPSLNLVNELQRSITGSKMLIKNWVFIDKQSGTPDKKELVNLLEKKYPKLRDSINQYKEQWDTKEREALNKIVKNIEDSLFVAYKDIIVKLSDFDKYEDPTILFEVTPLVMEDGEIIRRVDKIALQIQNLNQFLTNKVKVGNTEIINSFIWFSTLLLLFFILILGTAIISSTITIRAILTPVALLKDQLLKKSKGYFLDEKIAKREDEVGDMINAINTMSVNIRRIVDQIKQGATEVAQSSREINGSARNIATGANQQAASTEEVTASIEEMTATISQNAMNAKKTDDIARKVNDSIGVVLKSVAQSNKTMADIVQKTSIIKEIAQRIDLLAINAAIEAARAGEHGKGFAVVASEVRNLAESSQKAAIKIDEVSQSSLIIAEKSLKLLENVIPDIQETLHMVGEISTSSQEQEAGITQINNAVIQLSLVAQQNSSASEELSTSSDVLLSQSNYLLSSISFFKTENEELEDESTIQLEQKINDLQQLLTIRKKKKKDKKINFEKTELEDTNEFSNIPKPVEPLPKAKGIKLEFNDEDFEPMK